MSETSTLTRPTNARNETTGGEASVDEATDVARSGSTSVEAALQAQLASEASVAKVFAKATLAFGIFSVVGFTVMILFAAPGIGLVRAGTVGLMGGGWLCVLGGGVTSAGWWSAKIQH